MGPLKACVKLIPRIIAVAVALGACSAPSADNAESGGYSIQTVERALQVALAGPDAGSFQGRSKLRIQVPKGAPLNFVVVSTPGYLDIGGGLSLSIGITLWNAYDGDGSYTIAAEQSGATASKVTFYARNTAGKQETLRTYNAAGAPCKLTLRDNATSGAVDCPVVRSVERTEVSFRMRWGD